MVTIHQHQHRRKETYLIDGIIRPQVRNEDKHSYLAYNRRSHPSLYNYKGWVGSLFISPKNAQKSNFTGREASVPEDIGMRRGLKWQILE